MLPHAPINADAIYNYASLFNLSSMTAHRPRQTVKHTFLILLYNIFNITPFLSLPLTKFNGVQNLEWEGAYEFWVHLASKMGYATLYYKVQIPCRWTIFMPSCKIYKFWVILTLPTHNTSNPKFYFHLFLDELLLFLLKQVGRDHSRNRKKNKKKNKQTNNKRVIK
jgi:hypothetical protein